MATEGDSKKLSDLRVVDLRAELEKRGLDKTGVKANLIERLQKALIQEGKDPEEYEFDLSDKKPSKRLSPLTRTEENDANADQSVNDSSVLMIETPSLETSLDTNQDTEKVERDSKEMDKKDEITNAESPLNLSIGEEDENLLLNSGDENDKTEDLKEKDEDEKTAVSNHGASSENAKELENSAKELDEDKDDDDAANADADVDVEEEQGTNREDTVAEGNRSESLKNEDSASTINEVSSAGASSAPASTTNTTSQSEKDNSKNEKDKDKEKSTKSNPGRSLWVTNLLPSTRAQELKHLLSRYGKVIGAKVVQSSRYPRQRCYGYVTMETRAAADLCIEKLNNTELKGQIIRVAKVRPEHSLPMKAQKQIDMKDKDKKRRSLEKNGAEKSPEKKKILSANEKKKDKPIRKESKEVTRESRNTSRSSVTKKNRSLSKSSSHRADRKSDILTFDKIREERERQRQRERERALREEEKRRREIQRAREIEKRQREEAMRLEREREKLRIERERLDRQRVEIMRLERERQRLEREKLEQEKQELRRQQLRLEEARRPVKRPSSTSASTYRRDSASYTDDRKRLTTDRHYDETPPPPRFEVSSRESASDISSKKELPPKDYKSRIAYSKRSEEYPKRNSEFKRDYPPAERHSGGHPAHLVHSINSSTNSSKYDSSTYVSRERERDIHEPSRREAIIPNVPPPRLTKDARYGERSGERSPVSYRPVRDERERRPVADHHTKGDLRSSRDHRYTETAMKDGARYRDSNSWHTSGASQVKPFSGIAGSAGSSRESWSKSDNWRPMEASSNERWGNSSSRLILSSSSGVPNTIYSGGNSNMSGIGPGLACPPPPGNSSYSLDRFDNYKSLNSSRKY